MSDLRDLYQETILDHGKHPRNFGRLEPADASADGHNPLCGDRLTVFLQLDGERIERIRFEGNGCAISMASASMMAQALEGRTIDEARRIFDAFHGMVAGGDVAGALDAIGKLRVFEGVREFPVRVKCATLAWHTLRAALEREAGATPTSTEE